MNRETRTFIWGLILLVISSFSIAHIGARIYQGDSIWFNYVLFIGSFLGFFSALRYIFKTID